MKIGEYVRIKNGDIGKIKENDGELIKYCVGTLYGIDLDRNCLDREVLKSSPNIIDLIKKKDIVIDYKGNIYQVVKVWKGYVFTNKKNKYGQVITLVDYQIKSIVTKEQFSQMEYKVNE